MTAVEDPVLDTAQDGSEISAGWQSKYQRVLAMTDGVAVLGALAAAQLVRFGLPRAAHERYVEHVIISVFIAIAWLVALTVNSSRSTRILGTGAEEYRRVWLGTLWIFGAVAIASMLLKLEIARGYLSVALPTGLILLLSSRWVARRYIARQRARFGRYNVRVLIVGSPAPAARLAASLVGEPASGYQVVGVCSPDREASRQLAIPGVGDVPLFGAETTVAEAACATRCNAVAVVAAESMHGPGVRQLSWALEKLDISLLVAPGVIDIAGFRLHMRPVAGLPLIQVEKPQYQGAQRFQKRLFDLGFASAVLILGSPVFLLIALAVKLTSPGPVFYRQERIGLDGIPFRVIKFRTMVIDADVMVDQLITQGLAASPRDPFKFVDDPRVTSVGRFLRKYSLDELPQFLNVLKRDMSVVGPRPQVASEVSVYDDQTRRRLLVRPGITGLWQVSGRSNLSWEDSIRLDLYYVENWSMMADFLIALKTAKVVLRHEGAY